MPGKFVGFHDFKSRMVFRVKPLRCKKLELYRVRAAFFGDRSGRTADFGSAGILHAAFVLFSSDDALTPQQIDIVVQWVDGGAAEGTMEPAKRSARRK